jgi:putative PIN family toxin of toxin-antitoxin system
MRIILDTNVFVSGIFFTGPPYRILEAWRDRKIELVVSPEILEEYQLSQRLG